MQCQIVHSNKVFEVDLTEKESAILVFTMHYCGRELPGTGEIL